MVKTKVFQVKTLNPSNFKLQKSYIPQKKAQNICDNDSARKMRISGKNLKAYKNSRLEI